jgi:hypothetical protein
MECMATPSTTLSLSDTIPASTLRVNLGRQTARRRRISPQAGRALEILGHAIEYLADEYAHEADGLSSHDGRLEAMQLLMSVNRQIYFACPEVPTMMARWRSLFQTANS